MGIFPIQLWFAQKNAGVVKADNFRYLSRNISQPERALFYLNPSAYYFNKFIELIILLSNICIFQIDMLNIFSNNHVNFNKKHLFCYCNAVQNELKSNQALNDIQDI